MADRHSSCSNIDAEQERLTDDSPALSSDTSRPDTSEGDRSNNLCSSSFGYFRGYGIVITLASFISYTIQCATQYTIGIYYVAWLDEWEAGAGMTSSIGSIGFCVRYLTAIPAGYLTNRFGFRAVMVAGGLIATSGILATVFAGSIYVAMVTYAFVGCIGLGLAFVPAITIPSFYFDEGRAFVLGFVASGCGLGQFFMSYVLSAAIENYTWRGAMFITAGITLQLVVMGALMRLPNVFKEVSKTRRERDRNCCSGWRSDFAMYKLNLVLYNIHSLLFMTGLTIIYVHITAVTKALSGATDEQAVLPLSLLGISQIVGRLLSGFVGSMKNVDVFLYYLVLVTISGLSAMLLPLIGTYHVIVTWSLLFGILCSPYPALYQVMLLHFTDIKDLTIVVAHGSVILAIGAAVGAPLAGWLYDLTNDYSWSFYLAGGLCFLSGLVIISPYISVRRTQTRRIYMEESMRRDGVGENGQVSNVDNVEDVSEGGEELKALARNT